MYVYKRNNSNKGLNLGMMQYLCMTGLIPCVTKVPLWVKVSESFGKIDVNMDHRCSQLSYSNNE